MQRRYVEILSPFTTYALYFLSLFSLSFVENPFPVALLFSALYVGFGGIPCCILYILTPIASFSFSFFWIYFGQACLLLFAFFIRRKYPEKTAFLPFLALFFCLALYVLFSSETTFAFPPLLDFLEDPFLYKICLSALTFLFSSTTTISLNALSKKLLKCRLKGEEILFSALFFVVCGFGLCKAISLGAYMGVAFFILLSFSALVKDSSTLLCAFLLAIPALLSGGKITPFFVYGVSATLFSKSGRFFTAIAHLCIFFFFCYLDGVFWGNDLIFHLLSALIPTLAFLFIPPLVFDRMENKLIFYRDAHLPRVAINRNRTAIGEKLFEISGVFREISDTFSHLSDNKAGESAMEFIRHEIESSVCKDCPTQRSCQKKGRDGEFLKLIEIGVAKGKASLIDIPESLAEKCGDQSGILFSLNAQLREYHKYMVEVENAKAGRNLLSNQAKAISEILKNLALEQSAPLPHLPKKEKELHIALLRGGIVASEILLTGEDESSLSLITVGDVDPHKIARISSTILEKRMIVSEKLTLGKDRFCYILHKKPLFDASFGVATRGKDGEVASGDTHSIVKIDERKFLVALSDGMGSGVYAQKISESTISLLESFYRAKMPSPLVLSTINKLLTFSKEESFACVDIATVDLDTGRADVVKIGSPMGFILSGNTLKILDCNSLPLGILDSLHPNTSTHQLIENDILLFLSDGITGAFPSSSELCEGIKKLSCGNPQEFVNGILETALSRYGGTAKDDMTALAVRLFKSK